jgi:hypothetical protein
VGSGAQVAWNGVFWPSAPALTAGLCGLDDAATRAAAEAALTRLGAATARGLGWQVVRDDAVCDEGATQPRLLITRAAVAADAGPAVRTTFTDVTGTACATGADGPACWAQVAAISVNPAGFDPLPAEEQATDLLRELAHALGLGEAAGCTDSLMAGADRCPDARAADLGPDDIASLNELLAVTLKALQAAQG